MRKFWIDTDVASDDAVAMIMALHEETVHVEGISLVTGYRPVSRVWQNAFHILDAANTYFPPVYPGCEIPLRKFPMVELQAHGEDGLGDMGLPLPSKDRLQKKHGVDALIECIYNNPHEIEVVALAPLTNIALAMIKEPGIVPLMKSLVIMGGSGVGPGNVTPLAEANIYGDPDAAQIVLESGIKSVWVGFDACQGEAFYEGEDIEKIAALHTKSSEFFLSCNRGLLAFHEAQGHAGLSMPDPAAMAIAIWPDMEAEGADAYVEAECSRGVCRAALVVDVKNEAKNPPNAHCVFKLDVKRFKEEILRLFSL